MKVVGTSTLGFPRMGPNRELKKALELYWKGKSSQGDLLQVLYDVEKLAWDLQSEKMAVGNIQRHHITVGDSYLYDGILAWAEYLGIVPKRHQDLEPGIDRVFAMARGVDGATALSMKKWITSNYHYMVPELDEDPNEFVVKPNFDMFLRDVKRGVDYLGPDRATPVLIGPVTMVYLTKISGGSFAPGFEHEQRRQLLAKLLPAYKTLLSIDLPSIGVSEVQLHEAALVMEDPTLLELFQAAYPEILPSKKLGSTMRVNIVGSFMEDVGEDHYKWLVSVPEFDIISLDLTRGDNLQVISTHGFPTSKILGAGLLDSRSVWRVDPAKLKPTLHQLSTMVDNIRVQPSGSLQYIPWTIGCETDILAHPAGSVLSFAKEKLEELAIVAEGVTNPKTVDVLSNKWVQYATASNNQVQKRIHSLTQADFVRSEPFNTRRSKQLKDCPILPTTTIGSFPQTKQIRQLRAKLRKGEMTKAEYEHAIDLQIAVCIGIQESLGLDIFVHGEPERTDMVEFFAQKMEGMLFTTNGWVQSFGSRCVRPPIIWSDIFRPDPMTVREFRVAQGLTEKPVKGMLTGPVTILNWSFPRSDISRKEQAFQLGLAIRDEIEDLEAAGCVVIQVDEPALREAMPMRAAKKQEYLDWAVDAFRLATSNAAPETQIHTHMCYCEFADCMEAIDKLDTDVNSIENARSDNATLLAFKNIGYTKDLGPGTYDIHSPVVPSVSFIHEKLKTFLKVMEAKNLIVNPDCGLKTRTWPETIEALKNMVQATELVRAELHTIN